MVFILPIYNHQTRLITFPESYLLNRITFSDIHHHQDVGRWKENPKNLKILHRCTFHMKDSFCLKLINIAIYVLLLLFLLTQMVFLVNAVVTFSLYISSHSFPCKVYVYYGEV